MARDLREMIQILADKGDEVYSKICKVDRVDEARRVIDATPINGDAQVLAVRLQPVEKRNDPPTLVPKVGSFVMVTFFGVYDAYMAMGTVFEKVLLDIGDIHLELLNPEGDGKKALITVRNGDEQTGPCIVVDEKKILMRNGDKDKSEDEKQVSIELSEGKIKLNGGEKNKYFANGTVVKEQLNRLEEYIKALRTIFSLWKPVPSDGGEALSALIKSNWPQEEKFDKTDDTVLDKNITN